MITQGEVQAFILGRVVAARVGARFNKSEMARRMNMTASTWWSYEKGEYALDLYKLMQVAEATDRNISFFLPGGDQPDLTAALEARFPDATPETLTQIVKTAEAIYSLQDDRRSNNDQKGSSSERDMPGSKAGQ